MILAIGTIQALTGALLALLIIVMLLIALVLLYGFSNYKIMRNQVRWGEYIESVITTAILEGSRQVINDPNLLKLLKNNDFNRVFLSKLIASDKKFSGDAHRVIVELFYSLGLDKVALNKLRSSDVFKKMRGMHALRAMRVHDVLDEITPLLLHKNTMLVAETQYTIVRLRGFEGISFLESSIQTMSMWQQIRILRSINEVPPNGYSLLSRLLKHENSSIVAFTLSIIRKFRLMALHEQVLALQSHPLENLRILAIKTLSDIEEEKTIGKLLEFYSKQPTNVKRAVIEAIKATNSLQYSDFLCHELLITTDSPLALTIAQTLVAFGKTANLQEMLSIHHSSEFLSSIINHALKVKL